MFNYSEKYNIYSLDLCRRAKNINYATDLRLVSPYYKHILSIELKIGGTQWVFRGYYFSRVFLHGHFAGTNFREFLLFGCHDKI